MQTVFVRDLSVKYPTGLVALDGVSLTLTPGLCGLLGPNGAGKTTLLRVLSSILLPTGGEVSVAGFSLPEQAQEARGHIGYLPQQFGLFPNLRCWECLDYIALLKGLVEGGSRRRQVGRAWRRSTYLKPVTAGSAPFRAGCCGGWAWPKPCWVSRRYCSWTNRRSAWIPRNAPAC